MVLIAWNSSRSLTKSRTILWWPIFVDQIHLHKRQHIMPPQWLGGYLHMCPKILQGHIVHVHLGFMQPQLVLPHLQAMYYAKEFFLMSCLSFWQPLSFMLSYAMAIQLASTLRQCKITRPRRPAIRFVKFRELEHGRQDNLLWNSPKAWWQSSSHSWDTIFPFNKSDKVLTTL